jgi:hypothetical protein
MESMRVEMLRYQGGIPEKTSNDVFQKTSRLLFHKLRDHVAEDSADGKESFVGGAYVIEAVIIEEDLLHNENRNSLAQFGPGLHDTETQRYNLRREKKIDNFG